MLFWRLNFILTFPIFPLKRINWSLLSGCLVAMSLVEKLFLHMLPVVYLLPDVRAWGLPLCAYVILLPGNLHVLVEANVLSEGQWVNLRFNIDRHTHDSPVKQLISIILYILEMVFVDLFGNTSVSLRRQQILQLSSQSNSFIIKSWTLLIISWINTNVIVQRVSNRLHIFRVS